MRRVTWPAENALQLIGNTPLLRLRALEPPGRRVRILAKAEWYNPGGSIKDRPVLRIIEEAERRGELGPGKVVLDASSGNAGIAYAMISAIKGYRAKIVIPSNVSASKIRVLRALGAELVLSDPLEGSDGAIRLARRLYEENPRLYFYGDQYSNEANWRAHYETTGHEILAQTGGKLTHFVAGVGTSGTLMGVGRRLKEHDRSIKLVEVQPQEPLHGIEGLKHMASSEVPKIYDASFADVKIEVSTGEAQGMVKRVARHEGLLVGTSSGANLAAALRLAGELEEGTIVTVLPDGAAHYLEERYWEEVEEQGG